MRSSSKAPLCVSAQTCYPPAAQASVVTLRQEITALQERIVRAQVERDA
jgi:hypothetical protein